MKYMSQVHVSFEHIRKKLGLPDDIEIIRASVDDERGSIRFILQSPHEVKNMTFPTKPGTAPVTIKIKDFDDYDGGTKVKLPIWYK
jgi:hypothetical protein